MPWTDNQIDAIESTGGSVLVSAAAGSGKTSVLSERVIRMITREENPVPADKLLIVTFTNDAAAEMKQRINDKLNELLESDSCSSELIRQKQRFYNATISTIDSFCGSLVREYFHQLGISNDYRIADESELLLIKQKALDNTFARFYAEKSDKFKDLVKAFLYKNSDLRLRDCVLRVSTFLECVPFPENWLDGVENSYKNFSVRNSDWTKEVLNRANDTAEYLIRIVIRSLKLAKTDSDLGKKFIEPYSEGLSELIKLRRIIRKKHWDEASSAVRSVHGFDNLKAMPSNKGLAQRLEFSSYKKQIPELLKELREIFYATEKEITDEAAALQPVISELVRLVKAFEEELREQKLKKNILYFPDTSHLTVNLLAEYDETDGYRRTPLAQEISRRFDAVIVDEYQDINDVQDLIFNCVSNGSNLFVVGDVKQSIYTFRQTRPKLFTDRRDSYYRYNKENPKYPATIFLDKNFRSRKEVCDTVNFIFKLIMCRKTADIDYTRDDYLNVGASYGDTDFCETEIALLDCNKIAKSILGIEETNTKSKKKFKLDEKTGESPTSVEVKLIAKRIHELMASSYRVTDKNGSSRPAEYRDFAVIMRSPGGSGGKFKQKDENKKGAAEIVRILREQGIPAHCEQGNSLFDNTEIKLLLNILRIIDNPVNDIPMLSVLISPVYGFTPDELAEMRSNDRYSSLYDCLKTYSETNEKAAAFINQLSALRYYSASCTVDELLGRIYELSALSAITSAVKGGSAPDSELNLMRVYARSYEANGYKSLSDFIGFIDRLIQNKNSPSSAPSADSGTQNRVRVLSIHKSKGLEFPVVFLVDTAHGFNEEDLRANVMIDSESGIGIKRVNGIFTSGSYARKAIILKKRHEQIADELRLLYVALTRAREKLIITSSVNSSPEYIEEALTVGSTGKINPFVITESKCMLKWIMAAAAANPYCAAQMKGGEAEEASGYPRWKFTVIENFAQLRTAHSAVTEAKEPKAADSFNYADLLRKNLAFKYRNQAILTLPQKVSASEIAHNQNDFFEAVIAVPKFIEKRELSATERGTAHHEFLRYCDFTRAASDLDSEITKLTERRLITQKQADSIDRGKLSAILGNPFFERINSSPRVFREEKFTVEIPPSLIDERYKGVDGKAGCIMQGSVDLAFEENGKLVIVDYKTDYVREPAELAARYSKQLELYKEAMTQTLNIEVEELYIFSLYLNEVIKL